MFEKYASLQPRRDDTEVVKQQKRQARDSLARLLSELEEQGLKVRQKRSLIYVECSHAGKFSLRIYPTLNEWIDLKWVSVASMAKTEHRRQCPETRQ